MRVSARGLVPLLFFYLARSRRSGRFRSGQVGSGDGSVAEVGAEVCGTRERLCSSRLGPCLVSYCLACHHVIGRSVNRSIGQVRLAQSASMKADLCRSVAWGFDRVQKWSAVCEKTWSQSRS